MVQGWGLQLIEAWKVVGLMCSLGFRAKARSAHGNYGYITNGGFDS